MELPGYRIAKNPGVVRGIVVSYDANEITAGVTEVLVHGTAVQVAILRG